MKKHAFDPISFLFGSTFAVVGLIFLVGDVNIIDLGWRWVWPAPLIFLGALLLTLTFKRTQRIAPANVEAEPPEEDGLE